MSIQYPKIEHVTLPSVDGFNGTFNILRDPPKSVFTRRIDKVLQNNDMNVLIDGSGDRMGEAISVYARGVNPMVSVSYDNNSNNAGSFTNSAFGQGNSISQGHHQGQSKAFLPYRIADRGAFRPPVRTQRELLALSRQPRAWFEAMSKPGFTDYTKQKYLPTKFRMIRDLIQSDIKPNQSVAIEKPILENMKMQQAINDKHITIEAFSGKRDLDYSNFTRENVDQYKGIQENYQQVHAITNKRENRSHNLKDMNITKEKYVHDRTYYDASSNPSMNLNQGMEGLEIDRGKYIGAKDYYDASSNPSMHTNQGIDGFDIDRGKYIGSKDYYDVTANKGENIHTTSLEEMNSNNKITIKGLLQFQTKSGKNTGYTLLTDIPEMELEHHMPRYNVTASMNDPTVHKYVRHENELQMSENLPKVNTVRNVTRLEDLDTFEYATREYKLPPMLQKGQFLNEGVNPTLDRSEIQFRSDPNKERIRKYMNDNQFSRFDH